MKKLILIICMVVLVTGCSTAPKALDPNYAAYQQAILADKPLVSITWDATGQKMQSLTVNQPIRIEQKQPDAPHPAWQTLSTAIRATGMVFGIVAAGDALEGLAGSVQGNSSYSAGGNMSGGAMDIPTTTTTTTNTETITGSMPESSPEPSSFE